MGFLEQEKANQVLALLNSDKEYARYIRIGPSDESYYYISKKLRKPIYLIPTASSERIIYLFEDENSIYKYFKGKQALSSFIDDIIKVFLLLLEYQSCCL